MSLIIIQGILSFFKYEEIILGRAFKWEKEESKHGWPTDNQYIHSLTLFPPPSTLPCSLPPHPSFLYAFTIFFLPSTMSEEQILSDQCRKDNQVVLGQANDPWLLHGAGRKDVWGENRVSSRHVRSREFSALGCSWNRIGTGIHEEIAGLVSGSFMWNDMQDIKSELSYPKKIADA